VKRVLHRAAIIAGSLLLAQAGGRAAVVFEATSPYHHVRVWDDHGIRMLSFDNSTETRMSLRNPLQGHFEYTEYFHLPWLWNTQMVRVLMLGLGGASTQRSYQHYYPQVKVETVELDPMVVRVASNYFGFRESASQQVQVEDGRVHLRRSATAFDAILVDAYVANRYGSFIPYHLATREFFELASRRLATNGVLAYNVIGQLDGWRADVLGSVYATMKTAFPQVYLFPARETMNVVLIGVKAGPPLDANQLQQRAAQLIQSGRITLPSFHTRLQSLRPVPPDRFRQSQILTDDFAPIDGMLTRGR
jgi:spermidine synthase